jgi:hypothetical protein
MSDQTDVLLDRLRKRLALTAEGSHVVAIDRLDMVDALAEIERLRARLDGMTDTAKRALNYVDKAREAAKPEGWEMKYVVVPADQLTYEFTTHETEASWQPFAVGQLSDFSRARVWFRRRVPA